MRNVTIVIFIVFGIAVQGWCNHFIDNGNGTVTDLSTGLIWQQKGNILSSWKPAIAYCEELSIANKQDWRLPSIKEILTIHDIWMSSQASELVVFPRPISSYILDWAATYTSRSGNVWIVYFYNWTVSDSLKSSNRYVRCVR